MRNLEECTAEVFRRSEERILHRKRIRNRVIACCIPLCLVLAAVLTIPKEPSLETAAPEASPENFQLQDGTYEEEKSTHSLQVCSDGRQIAYSCDARQVSEIHAYIQKLQANTVITGSNLFSDVTDDGQLELGEDAQIKYYGMFLAYDLTIAENGTLSRYTLQGRSLKDMQTGLAVTLSETQLTELLKQLGVPNEKEGAQ